MVERPASKLVARTSTYTATRLSNESRPAGRSRTLSSARTAVYTVFSLFSILIYKKKLYSIKYIKSNTVRAYAMKAGDWACVLCK